MKHLFYWESWCNELSNTINENEFKLCGMPTKLKYRRQQNGLYEVTVGDYDIISPYGDKHTGEVRYSDCMLNLDGDEGVLSLENMTFDDLISMLTRCCERPVFEATDEDEDWEE